MITESYFKRVQNKTPTQFFCDIASIDSLEQAENWGAVGATSNPPRIARTVRSDQKYWKKEVKQILAGHSGLPDDEIVDLLTQVVVKRASKVLLPVFKKTKGKMGYISMQGSPREYSNLETLKTKARQYAALAPNIAVKIPIHTEGLLAIEELAAEGINLTATTGYSVSQCISAAEAHLKGIKYARNNKHVSRCMVVIVVGRLDAHFCDRIIEENLTVPQKLVDQAGIAVAKKIYKLLKERNLPAMLLSAGARRPEHFTDFIGGKMGITIGPPVQEELIKLNLPVVTCIEDFPTQETIDELRDKVPDFCQAFDENGLSVEQMRGFGPCLKLEQYFNDGFSDLLDFVHTCRLEDIKQ